MSSAQWSVPGAWATLVDVLRWRASNEPQREAFTFLVDGDREAVPITYGELDRRARAIAATLQANAAQGERAILLFAPGLDYRATYFGCLYAGILPVPAALPRPEQSLDPIETIATVTQASLVVTTSAVQRMLASGLGERVALRRLGQILVDTVPAGAEERWQAPALNSDDLAGLFMTSGSTGVPKAAMHSHGGLLENLRSLLSVSTYTTESRMVSWLPPHFAASNLADTLMPVFGGFPVTLMPTQIILQSPMMWLEVMSRTHATHAFGVNFALDLCVNAVRPEDRERIDLSQLVAMGCGGEANRASTLERFAAAFEPFGFRPEAYTPGYGATEAMAISGTWAGRTAVIRTFDTAALERQQAREATAASDDTRTLIGAGRPFPGVEIAIVDPTTRTRCSADGIGEIWIAGPTLARGYWNQPDETEATFHAYLTDTGEGPFYRSGDLGFMHDGELFITSRLKEIIIIRGRNLAPQDIEQTVQQSHPALQATAGAAFSVDVDDDERLVAVQEVDPRIEVRGDVIDAVRRAVAGRHDIQPYAVVLIEPGTLPRTGSGKIQRRACREAFLNGSLAVVERSVLDQQSRMARQASFVAPRTAAEATLARIWATLLRVPEVSVEDNFFALGGDSLLSMQMIARVREAGWQLRVEQLLSHPTVADLAPLLQAAAPVTADQAAVSGPVPLTPRQIRWFDVVHPDALNGADVSVFSTREPLEPALMEQAVHHLVLHHDALRMRFVRDDAGWHQFNAPVEDQPVYTFTDLSALSADEQERIVRKGYWTQRGSLNIVTGPLMHIAHFHRGRAQPDVLIGAWNHLVNDAFSLRIILEDLATAYEQLSRGEEVDLGPKTTSFKAWAERLEAYAQSPDVNAELGFWNTEARAQAAPLPVDSEREGYGGSHLLSLSPEETEVLLRSVPRVFGTEINDVLLTALIKALEPWTGQRSVLVDLVSHGRAPLFPDVDLSRTVGYLAAHFPMLLELGEAGSIEEELRTVQAQLKAIPNGGVGYGVLRYLSPDPAIRERLAGLPEPQVMFKYDGQFDQTFDTAALFEDPFAGREVEIDPDEIGGRHLRVNPRISQGRLQVIVRSGELVHERATVEVLAERYIHALRTIIAACDAPVAAR
jgi:non-ribosomal peptide synthase protein (TIGR01720 family)